MCWVIVSGAPVFQRPPGMNTHLGLGWNSVAAHEFDGHFILVDA